MKLLIGVGVLFGALTLQVLYTEGRLGGGDVDTLKEKLDQLQDMITNELGSLREEIHGLKLKLRKKSKLMIKLQTDMDKLRSERASTPHLSLNLREGLLTEKRLRENTEIDLGELKTVVRQNAEKISALQIDTARLSKKNQSLCQCSAISRKIAATFPEFRFTRADGVAPDHVVIEAGGAVVRDGPDRAWSTTVRTDGLFPAGNRLYWETRLDWSPDSDPGSVWWRVGGVGVRREGSDFGTYPGYDDQSWAVEIRYKHNQKMWRYECLHGREYLFTSAPVTATSPSVSHRLGILLDPGAGTLTAVDVKTNTPIYTFSLPAGDAGSQRLVPVVSFGYLDFRRRFSLPGVDLSRLPGVVTDLLQN